MTNPSGNRIITGVTRVIIDNAKTFEARMGELQKKRNIRINPNFNGEKFGIDIGKGQQIFEMGLVKNLAEEEEMVKQGWKKGEPKHLIAYATQGWDGTTWVLARSDLRNELGRLYVPNIHGDSESRFLALNWEDEFLGSDTWDFPLLMVRECR